MTSHTPLYLALRAAGFTLRRAAAEFGVSEEHLSNIGLGRTYASEPVLLGLARLGINPNEVLSEIVLQREYNPRHARRSKSA
jgi:lambda repressor-like predicted transcriptional regulator